MLIVHLDFFFIGGELPVEVFYLLWSCLFFPFYLWELFIYSGYEPFVMCRKYLFLLVTCLCAPFLSYVFLSFIKVYHDMFTCTEILNFNAVKFIYFLFG